MTSQTKVVA